MAKVKFSVNKEMRIIKSNIMKYKTLENIKTKELAVAAGISFKCMYSRLEKPEEFITKLKDYTSKQMDAGASPEQVSKLVAELIELER